MIRLPSFARLLPFVLVAVLAAIIAWRVAVHVTADAPGPHSRQAIPPPPPLPGEQRDPQH